MTWPLVKPASGKSTLSRFDRESLRPSMSTSRRLAATERKVLAVQIEPDRGLRRAEDAPTAGQRLDEVQADPAASAHIRRPPRRSAADVIRVADLDVQAGMATLEQQPERRPRARTPVAHPV